jgi:POT family proton-dependent oligopeptide transporter
MTPADKRPFATLCALAALEKLGFNGIRALLVIYVARELLFTDSAAFGLYAGLMSLGYLAPLIGGYLADRHFGDKRVILLGACAACVGQGVLLAAGATGLNLALSLLLLGAGLMKAAIPSAVGKLPGADSTDARYALLYAAFNAGTLVGVFGCAAVGETLGWHYAFAIAGAAFAAAIPLAWLLPADRNDRGTPLLGFLPVLLLVPLFALALAQSDVLHLVFGLGSLVFLPALAYIGYRQGKLRETATLVVLMGAHAVCFALMEQVALSLTLFIERNVDRHWEAFVPGTGAGNIPVMFFQGIDPLLNIFMGGLFAWVWTRLQFQGVRPSVWSKFGLGLLTVAAAFAALASGCAGALGSSGRISPWLIVLVGFLVVIAEQLTVPIGFTAVKEFSPRGFVGFYMGCWFFSISLSELLAGCLAQLTATDQGGTVALQAPDYAEAFNIYSWIGAAAGLTMFAVAIGRRWWGSRPSSFLPIAPQRAGGDVQPTERSLGAVVRTP